MLGGAEWVVDGGGVFSECIGLCAFVGLVAIAVIAQEFVVMVEVVVVGICCKCGRSGL